MRPLSLEIAGFTCFVQPITISFEGMDVFAITGRTGSGKTTIMDAMCYALYGKVPRGTDVSKLVTHDAQKMHVSLVFEAGGRRYRAGRTIGVNRKTMKTTPSTVAFEGEIAGGEWEPLENRVREMNDAVERIVGLDYRAFTRCVLLPQGKFQEMLAGDTAERRAVLEDLLDIGIYERIMQTSGRRAREIDAQAKAIEHVLESTFADATEESLAARRKELEAAEAELQRERANRDALQAATQHVADWRAARTAERDHRASLDAKQKQLDEAEALTRDGEALLAQAAADVAKVEGELHSLEYDRALHMTFGAARAAAALVEKLTAEEATARSAAADRGGVAKAEAALKTAEAAEKEALQRLAAAEAALDDARREHAAAHVRAGLKAGDTCPVCANVVGKLPRAAAPALAATEKARDAAKKASDQAAKAANDARQRMSLAKRDAEQAATHADKVAGDLVRAQKDLAAQLPKGVKPELATISARLDELTKLGERVDMLTAQATELRKTRDRLDESMRSSRDVMQGLTGEMKTLAEAADTQRARGDEAIADLSAIVERHEWEAVRVLIAAKRDPSAELASMLDASQEACARLDKSIGVLSEQIQRIERDIEQAKEQRAEVERLRSEQGLYATLADVLQANKFRDWYIGEAMALLAAAATDRLRALDPDERYALEVERGAFVIVDRWQAGVPRSPETLSGGETFVVSLALALALAEQLPQIQSGAAAALESLFLDEGFGALDADTLEPVMNALEGLRMEGRMVGVVTHVRELAERIGTRIEVMKSQEGSTVHIAGAAA